jgi:thiosulfate reductase cytochrome b subunit
VTLHHVHGFIVTGIIFASLLFATDQWKRIVPTSSLVVAQAWNTWVHYATFRLPAEPNGFYGYNALQQIAYFCVFLVFGPLSILTGKCNVAGRRQPLSMIRGAMWCAMTHVAMTTPRPKRALHKQRPIAVFLAEWQIVHPP